MKLSVFPAICGLLLSGAVMAFTPVGPTTSVSTIQEYDIPSGAPADVYLWSQDYPGAYGGKNAMGAFYCGTHPEQQSCVHSGNSTTITVFLTEKRSKVQYNIKLKGYISSLYYDANNPEDSFVCGGNMALNNDYVQAWCTHAGDTVYWANARLLTVYIPQSEMNSLPIGGVWEGKLSLDWSGSPGFTYNADITLKGKATGKQDIYFPEFNGANPLVQLDLHPTGSVTSNYYFQDVTNLDMCLYDGFNSNSDSMTLSFKDEGKTASSRKGGYFSIYNTATGGTDTIERIDYRVEMFDPHSKSWRTVKNNDPFTLSAGVNGTDQIRPVRLPSITYPVLCAPAPLRLIVDKFHVVSKVSGYYKGILTVEFSPSLNSI